MDWAQGPPIGGVCNSKEPEGNQVYVQAGTVGEIVALTDDENAPFHIRFPEFTYKIAVRLEKLDLNPTGNYKYTLPAAWLANRSPR